MTDTLEAVDDAALTGFVDEMLDSNNDLGELAAAAFGVDPDTAWRTAITHIAALYDGTTSRSRGSNKARRDRASTLLDRLVANPHTSPDVMCTAVDVARNESLDWTALQPLMENPSTPGDVIDYAVSRIGSVLLNWGGGLSHPNTAHDLIRRHAKPIDRTRVDQILGRADVDADLLNWIAQNCVREVTDQFAERDDLTEDTYRQLAARGLDRDGSNNGGAHGGVRRYLGANPAVPVSLLDELAGDDHAQVRRAVAANPSTSDATLRTLLEDSHDRVVVAAFRQLRARGLVTIN
jgi:hypothetical protein